MIQKFSPNIKALIEKSMPAASQKIWWVRGIVLEVSETEHPTEKPEKQNPGGRLRDLVLKIGDVDKPSDGYDVRIEGIHHEVEVNDVVSLLGHEPKNARKVSYPRLFINHNTDQFARAYPLAARLRYGLVPIVEYKYWLWARLPTKTSFATKFSLAIFLLVICPFLLVALVLLGMFMSLYGTFFGALFFAFLAIAALPVLVPAVFFAFYVRWLNTQSRFSFEPYSTPFLFLHNLEQYFGYLCFDMTGLYEKLAHAIQAEVVGNPAPELDFVVVKRGIHTNGLLSAPVAVSPAASTAATLPPDANASGVAS